jgi:phosphoribosylaminoimidazolecarboxamide formyltransferase/IMP cyclohydrolase
MQKKRALISVYDKSNIENIVHCLINHNIDILATGGTLKCLQEKNIAVTDVTEYTHFPEMLDGRVKTLHPKLFGGILFKRQSADHCNTVEKHDIDAIDFVIVNLYPFVKKQKENLSHDELIEFIDIGGPSLLRAAAKNYKDVTIITDVNDYEKVIEELNALKSTTVATRKKLAAKVFGLTAAYDASIANFLNEESFTDFFSGSYELKEVLRYGENPHQQAGVYADQTLTYNIKNWEQLQGKELSYNNYRDIEAARNVVAEFNESACCAIKHNTPCGVALGKDDLEAYQKTFEADAVSIFGGIIAFNTNVSAQTAMLMNETFLEVVIAPSFDDEALTIFSKKKNLRILKIATNIVSSKSIISIDGGLLIQDKDKTNEYNIQFVTNEKPNPKTIDELVFAQKVVKHCSSNAIVISKNKTTMGIGCGQTNRIRAVEQAIKQVIDKNEDLSSCVLGSDAFFPFNDIVNLCGEHKIKSIIQPGGSVKDNDSIEACNNNGIAMVFTGVRHFKH